MEPNINELKTKINQRDLKVKNLFDAITTNVNKIDKFLNIQKRIETEKLFTDGGVLKALTEYFGENALKQIMVMFIPDHVKQIQIKINEQSKELTNILK